MNLPIFPDLARRRRRTRPPLRRSLRARRGSALILVVLLSLILAATAIVALRDVARSVQNSAVFRTRVQAQQMSSSAVQVYADRVGHKADVVLTMMESSLYGQEGTGATDPTGVFGGQHDTTSTLSFEERRIAQAVLGGHVEFEASDLNDLLGSPAGQTGLFSDGAGANASFETRRSATFRVIVRDLMDGPKAPGYSDEFCYKKATIASEAEVGTATDEWTGPSNVALARHAVDGLVGPSTKCGYHGN